MKNIIRWLKSKICLLFRRETIIVARWNVDSELGRASTGWNSLANTANIVYVDHPLNFLLVNVEDTIVCDGKHTLL